MTAIQPPPSKITVAHVLPWTGIGGVEIATLRMIEATRDQYRHVAFCLEDAPAVTDLFAKAGIETVTYAPPEPSRRHALRYFNASRAVARQLRQSGANIVHFAEVKAAYHISLAAWLARARVVCHFRVTVSSLKGPGKLFLLPVRSFLFVSQEAMQTFPLRLPPPKARVIYDAIEIPAAETCASDPELRHTLGIPRDAPVVGMLARVNPQKDYFTLADAAVEVLRRFPEARFLIVGDNSLIELNRSHYAEVAGRLAELGIADRFIFTGHRSDVQRLISAMDISVLSTHREGFPLSILETMAMGKPVIATSVGGIPEIVIPGKTGYLHQHENSHELAAAIVDLLANPEKARQIGLQAREYVQQKFSREQFVQTLTQAYQEVMRS